VDSLTRSHSLIDASWMNARLVGSELVVARCQASTLLDLVEEPLDQIPGSIEIRAKAMRPKADVLCSL
jgi:hypothetical protein